MQHVIQTGKRALSVAVAAATIMFSAGASLLAPSMASAASAGDLIKGTSLSTVYYYGFDGMRYTFPNEKTFLTWFTDFDDVTTISDSALAAISLAGNVEYRPGSYWVKIQSDPKTYAVSTDGTIHWIESEEVAVDLAGANWASGIHDVSDVFFTDYTVGTSLMTAEAFDRMLYMDGGDYFIVIDGEKREVSSAGRTANNLQAGFFLDGTGIDDSSLTAGAEITGEVSTLVDPAQTVTDEDTVTAGDLEISLASSNPAAATVPLSSTGIEMLSFDVEAGSEDSTFSQVTFTMSGLSASTDVGNVYLYEGVNRLTDARTVNSSTRMVTFGSLNLDVEANDTRTFTLRADEGTAAVGDIVTFSIASADDVVGSGDVDGSFPIEGNDFEFANVTAGTVTVSEYGTINNPTLGEDDAVIGKFKLAAASEDAEVQAITLKVDNSADHSDFWLWVDGEPVVEGTDIGDKLVAFDFSDEPIVIADGQNEIFELTADIGGENGDDVKVYVENAVDVISIGGDYGFGMAITTSAYDGDNSCTDTTDECSFSDVVGGDVTLVFNGPSAGDILVDSQDQVLLEFSMTSAEEITVKDLDIIVYGDDNANDDATDGTDGGTDADTSGLVTTGSVSSITDIKIVNADTGTVVMGPLELDNATDDPSQTIDFTDDFTLEAGETINLMVTVDVDDLVASGTEFAAAVDVSGFLPYDSNDDVITNIVPSADITGYNQEANASSITFARASSPASSNVVQGKEDASMLSISATAGDASDVTVTDLTFHGFADDTNASAMTVGGASGFQLEDLVSSCSLYDSAGELLAGPESLSTVGVLAFTDMDFVVPAGGVELLSLECDMSNPSQTDDDLIAFELESDASATTSTNVSVVDEDGDDVTVTITKVGVDALGLNDSSNDTVADMTVAMTVKEKGTITATASSGTPSADFLVTGSSNNHVGSFTYTATEEDFTISKLVIEEVSAAEFGGSAADYANNISLVTISYPTVDGTTDSATAIMSSASATFSGLNMFVDVDDGAELDVYVNVPASSRNAGGSATSNERIEVALADGATDMNAVGADSGAADTDIGAADVDTDRVYVVRETVPTFSSSSSTPTGAKVPGDQEVLRFNIAANSNEDVVFSELLFKVSATDNNGEGTTDDQPDWNECDSDDTAGAYGVISSDLDFYNLSEEGTSTALDVNADWSILVANPSSGTDTGSFTACGTTQYNVTYFSLQLTTKEVVPAGEVYTYSFYWDVSGAAAASDDVVQISLVADGTEWEIEDAELNETDVAITDTTVAVDSAAGFSAGDVIVIDLDADGVYDSGNEEVMLVTDASLSPLTVIRGYLGSSPAAADAGSGDYEYEVTDNVLRAPSSFVWEDDGLTGTDTAGEDWGAYLVDGISTVLGGSLSF